MTDSKSCWDAIKSCKKSTTVNAITPEEWSLYFEKLLNQPSDLDPVFNNCVTESLHNHDLGGCRLCERNEPVDLNSDITPEEVGMAIQKMPCKKAPGLDGLCIELFKETMEITVPLLTVLFNVIWHTGHFPQKWSHALLLPLYKKGSVSDPNNYRGISLLSVVSKIFTKILCTRLTEWAELNNMLYEAQAGFRKGRSTVDQIFSLQSLVQKYTSRRRGRFYVLFVDFAKAFDSIPHKHLWFKLLNTGVHGKFITALRAMYANLTTSVLTPDGVARAFASSTGTRQGCLLSPLLFVLYLNGLIELFDTMGCQGVYVSEEFTNVTGLFYADDLAEGSDTVGRLQKLIDTSDKYSSLWGLKVNVGKTKIIVFRNGGILRGNEKWFLRGLRLEVVSFYKYLGMIFTSRLCWTMAQKSLATQAIKAMSVLKHVSYKCGRLPPNTLLMLFDKMIMPVLLYGAEIWGYSTRMEIELVQVKYCKFVMGVSTTAPNAAVLGDCGRLPVAVFAMLRCVKYWLKILEMQADRMPRACYNMLYQQSEGGRQNWATEIRTILFSFGFGFVWMEQGVGDVGHFCRELKQRFSDCASQQWSVQVRMNGRLSLYEDCKNQLQIEKYLLCVSPIRNIGCIARLRCSAHALMIEKGRHSKIDRQDRLCLYCKKQDTKVIECEFHFVLVCKLYQDIREKYIARKYWKYPSHETFIELLTSESITTLNELARYLYVAFKIRNQTTNTCEQDDAPEV